MHGYLVAGGGKYVKTVSMGGCVSVKENVAVCLGVWVRQAMLHCVWVCGCVYWYGGECVITTTSARLQFMNELPPLAHVQTHRPTPSTEGRGREGGGEDNE